MERPGSSSSPARRNSNSQLLQELEALSQSLYKSQTPKRGGSISYVNEGIPLPGMANPRQETSMASKNKRHSFANPHPPSHDSASGELSSAGRKVRHSTSAASSFSGLNDAENTEIRGRRKRNSMSPFRWRRGEARHSEDDHDHASDIIVEDEFERKLEESGDKSKGFWNWKPMRALSHIGLHRFNCIFSVYVNAIEGLSSSMNGLRLTVLLRKKETKDGAVETMPCRVYEGSAEFEEILHIRCHVYGGKHHSQGFKFQSRPFTISVIAVDAEELDLGRHHLDLSMLLQDTERLQTAGEECDGWNVHYELWGKARGAKLSVSLGYEILDKDGRGSPIGNINSKSKDSHSREKRISKSLPGSARGTPKMVPTGFSYDKMGSSSPYNNHLEPGREMLHFVKMDKFNLNDEEVDHSHMPHNWVQESFVQRDGVGSSSRASIAHSTHQDSNMDYEASHVTYLQSNLQSSELDTLEEGENQEEEGDFEVVEKGVEIQRPVEEIPATAIDSEENLDNKVEKEKEEEAGGGEIVKEVVQEDQLRQSKRLTELDSIFEKIHALESVILEKTSNELSVDSINQNLGNEGFDDAEAKKSSDGAKKVDENIDEEAEIVEGEFLHMLEEEDAHLGERQAILQSPDPSEKDMELESILEAAENELQKATQSLESKRRAALLEDEETEALMHEWGLNEDVFQDSPPKPHNPAALASGQFKLPDLGEGLGCVVRTRDGGMLASMDPGHFRSGQRLVMHVSKPVVVPAEMGDNSVEILQRMAGMGTASMAAQAMACMPLDDITGKTVGQIAFEGMASVITNQGHSEHRAGSWKSKSGGIQTLDNLKEEHVSLESIAPVAVQQIEAMALEGLKIQAEMAEEEAPYTLPPVPLPKHGTLGQLLAAAADNSNETSNGLMAMAISLEEWTRIDAGVEEEEEETSAAKGKKTMAILAAHHAHEHNKNRENGEAHGHMGNALTIALLVQLRDPVRNYEAVGSPMIALVEAERVKVSCRRFPGPINGEEEKEDEMDEPRFKIKGVHLSGLKLQMGEKKCVWGSEKQFQRGSKWLLANGMGKESKHPLLKSKMHGAQSKGKQEESIWSISANSEKNTESSRNPDVVFPRRFTWRV